MYAVGDSVEVLVITRRGREPEWVPATIYHLDGDDGAITVMFTGQSKQRFLADDKRIRPAGALEGGEWVF